MKRVERMAAAIVLAIVIGVPAGLLSYQYLYRSTMASAGEMLLVARTVERGGWSPERIVVKQGQRIRLRVLAEDVTHGFQLLHFGIDLDPIPTGSIRVVEFTPDRVGVFPFYCNVRCSPLHMALMGVVEVQP